LLERVEKRRHRTRSKRREAAPSATIRAARAS